jgi:hypothetical protein
MKILSNLALICFLLFSNLVFAQQKRDSTTSSTRFLFPQFTDGVVVMKDGNVSGGKLNYDTSTDQMQFLGADNAILQIAEPEKVVKVVIANRTFVFLKNYFVEVIIDGPVLLYSRIHEQRIAEKVGAYGGSSPASSIQTVSTLFSGDGTINRLTANEDVTYRKELILSVSVKGKMRIISVQNDLLKCFSSKKELIQQEMDKQKTKISSLESTKKIIEWINTNGITD